MCGILTVLVRQAKLGNGMCQSGPSFKSEFIPKQSFYFEIFNLICANTSEFQIRASEIGRFMRTTMTVLWFRHNLKTDVNK